MAYALNDHVVLIGAHIVVTYEGSKSAHMACQERDCSPCKRDGSPFERDIVRNPSPFGKGVHDFGFWDLRGA